MNSPVATIEAMNSHNARIPFNAWLGIKVLSASASTVSMQVPWRPEFSGMPGMTHGGILASIVDTAAYMALMAAGGGAGPTVDMRMDFHRSTANGSLSVEARLLRAGATISTVDVVIKDAQERLVASGRCVFLSKGRKSGEQA